jgi:hypothetical protein
MVPRRDAATGAGAMRAAVWDIAESASLDPRPSDARGVVCRDRDAVAGRVVESRRSGRVCSGLFDFFVLT